MNSPLQETFRLLAALVGLVGLSSCGGGGSEGPAEQSIALFSPIADQRFSSVPVALTALSSSGLAVEFSSATPSVCTVSGSTAVLVNVGTCTVMVHIPAFARCVPKILISDPCVCKNNATTLFDGQFGETIKIEALAGKVWTVTPPIASAGLAGPNFMPRLLFLWQAAAARR